MSALPKTLSPTPLSSQYPADPWILLREFHAKFVAGTVSEKVFLAQIAEIKLDGPDSHKHYAQIGELCVEQGHWEIAEHMAVAALRALPRFGAAFKLLARALSGAGFSEEAAVCHRYGLPERILEKHFAGVSLLWTDCESAASDSISKLDAYPEEHHPLMHPGQLDPAINHPEFGALELHSAAAFTVRVKSATIWFDGFNTIVWDEHGRLIKEVCRGYAAVVQGSLGDRKPVSLRGTLCILANRNPNNYYHWMHDIVPRLEVIRAAGIENETIDWFLCNPIKTSFQKQMLDHFAIDEQRIVTQQDGEYFQVDELLCPVYGSNSLGKRQAAWNPQFYKRAYLNDILPCQQDLKLYVSRGSEGARGILNDVELIQHLEANNFTVVRPEKLSVAEQAKMFARASVVLGPHGAGFSNIVFCQPGTRVIELFHAHIHPCFHVISEVSGLQHYIHFCGQISDDAMPDDLEKYNRTIHTRRNSPFTVDPLELDKILKFAAVS